MNFFDNLPKVNKLFVMREALIGGDKEMFASMALRSVTEGHLTMHELADAFGRNMDNPDHNPHKCDPLNPTTR